MKLSTVARTTQCICETIFSFCFSDTILFLSGWQLMRNATLSCITFLWMNIRVPWSFQAVGVKTVIFSLSLSLSSVLSAAGQTIPHIAFVSWPVFIHHLLWPSGFQTLPLAYPKYHFSIPQWQRAVYHSPTEYSSFSNCLYMSLYFSVCHPCICCLCFTFASHMCYQTPWVKHWGKGMKCLVYLSAILPFFVCMLHIRADCLWCSVLFDRCVCVCFISQTGIQKMRSNIDGSVVLLR